MSANYSLGSNTKELERLKSQVDLYGDRRDITFGVSDVVADIGCGPGSNLWIAQQSSSGKYIGLDIDQRQIESGLKASKQLGLPNAEFHLIDGHHLPLSDSSVDVAFARCVLIHQPDPLVLAEEMFRITKKGGKVIVIEPHAPTYYCAPKHEHLVKCYRARTNYAYSNGKGSADIALNLYPLFKNLRLTNIQVKPHIIAVFGEEDIQRSKALLDNWLGQIKTVAEALVEHNLVSKSDLRLAAEEAEDISADTFIYQSLWIAQELKASFRRGCLFWSNQSLSLLSGWEDSVNYGRRY